MAMGHHEAAGAEHGGRSEDRADVVRVCDLIEHDQRPAIGNARQFVPVWLGQWFRFERDALMDGVGTEEAIEVAWGHAIDLGSERTDGLRQTAFSVFRQQEAMNASRGVLYSGLDSMQPKEQERTFCIVT